MDETELRQIAERLRAALRDLIADDTERAAVAAELDAAMATPAGSGRTALGAALEARPETRKWLRERLPPDTEKAINVPGDPTAVLGTLFVCPVDEEFDFVRETVSQPVPPCPIHSVALVRVEG